MRFQEVKSALQERLSTLETLWQKRDYRGIVRELYTDSTEVTGAGNDLIYSGTEELESLVEDLVGGSSGASIRIDRLTPLGDSAAYTWVTWDIKPVDGESFSMKSLFVWSLCKEGWRIVADMYAEGEIPA
ncbi:hypothetical protein SRABI70_00345 [Pseudomonas sp. Bi70]|uniref:DUF4440 domain-containing protein n=1 Tax=Pseudomonas sp. Bi70 TaxID=2821127 RepID=UPI001D537B10|nr:DUF4440 domain-containing protein [Pseudomonas sp. Bi70]CAH0143497.1 hypothetical protein SRABI70_00345 [Pseudomonas sp. Bi70]